jgi:hypothetical protein
MAEVELRLTDEHSRRLWSSVADLTELLPAEWVLVGGLMVQLYALEAGVEGIRATIDVDVLGQGRPPGALAAIDEALGHDGFELQLPADGVVRRYLRGALIVDVLVPDGMRDGIGVPGGSQALARSESVTIRLDGRSFVLRRPTLLGAILIKARSLLVHRDPEAQREDLLLLLSLVDDPRAMSEQMKRSERRWLRDATERLEFDRPANIGADRIRLARLTHRLLLQES